MKFLILLCSASLLHAAVEGTVTNQTTGKPQPGATVTLYKLGQNGIESVESVKTDAAGTFRIDQNLKGPRLLQSAYDGVTYNHMLPPGAKETGVALDVYNSSKQPGGAKVMQHMVILEPGTGEMTVSEGYIWLNTGKTTFNDLDAGTLRFYAPPGSKGIQVNATAPQGMPIRTAPSPTKQPDVYKIDFPIKPGETNIQISYTVPFTSPGSFEGKVFYKGGPTSLIVPDGVTVKGEGLESRGQEPRTKASIYQTSAESFKVQIEGSGELKRGEAAESEQGGPQIQFVLPKLYDKLYWVLALSFSILILGFVLLYRAGGTAAPVRKK
ncbi:MAG TPA: carboxypeptidase-like regulatory domain-containing protein [Bryobacteraceae bacterium]|jgi:hypothetical protein|nr:carboxypeptidase-like regulatory domain-containing protein [Bryobacteraceae bacterium]